MSDVPGILSLLNTVFKPMDPFTEEWWFWKYHNNPSGFQGERGDIWVAEDRGKIVGHYAVLPVKVKIGAETKLAGQSVDTAVHPEYRRMGIFSTLAGKVYADIQGRYCFLFGYPSEMAYKGFLELGWKNYPVSELVKFVNYRKPLLSVLSNNSISLAAAPLLKMWETMKRLSSVRQTNREPTGDLVTMERRDRFEDEFDAFWRVKRADASVTIERTVSYLNWRFSKIFGAYQIWVGKSARDGRIVGYAVFRETSFKKIKNVLDVVDLCALPGEDKFVLGTVDLSLRIAKEKDLDLLHIRLPVWHEHYKIFSSRGFMDVESILSKMGMYQPKLILYDFEARPMTFILKQWCYSSADTDYA